MPQIPVIVSVAGACLLLGLPRVGLAQHRADPGRGPAMRAPLAGVNLGPAAQRATALEFHPALGIRPFAILRGGAEPTGSGRATDSGHDTQPRDCRMPVAVRQPDGQYEMSIILPDTAVQRPMPVAPHAGCVGDTVRGEPEPGRSPR